MPKITVGEWTLVDSTTGWPIMTGDVRYSFRASPYRIRGGTPPEDEHLVTQVEVSGYRVRGGTPPKHSASTGRVEVEAVQDEDSVREFYPSVVDAEWVRGVSHKQLTSDFTTAGVRRMLDGAGSFAGHLARAYQVADLANKALIMGAFSHLILAHAEDEQKPQSAEGRLHELTQQLVESLRWALDQVEDDLDLEHQDAVRTAHQLADRLDRMLQNQNN